jgi:hypothetical protein
MRKRKRRQSRSRGEREWRCVACGYPRNRKKSATSCFKCNTKHEIRDGVYVYKLPEALVKRLEETLRCASLWRVPFWSEKIRN